MAIALSMRPGEQVTGGENIVGIVFILGGKRYQQSFVRHEMIENTSKEIRLVRERPD